MDDPTMNEPLPYWIETPVEPRRCLLCDAPGEVHCSAESRPRDIRAARAGRFDLHLFVLCQPCADRAHKRLRLIETVLEMNYK